MKVVHLSFKIVAICSQTLQEYYLSRRPLYKPAGAIGNFSLYMSPEAGAPKSIPTATTETLDRAFGFAFLMELQTSDASTAKYK